MVLSIIFRYLLLNKIILFFLSFNTYIESSSVIGDYPTLKRLNNGQYFVISSNNIVIADSTFTNITEKLTFTSRLYSTLTDTYSTTIAQFPQEDNGYIIAIIKNDLYVFDKNGDCLYESPEENFVKIGEIYNIIPFGKSDNTHYFYIVCGKKFNDDDDDDDDNDDDHSFSALNFFKCL